MLAHRPGMTPTSASLDLQRYRRLVFRVVQHQRGPDVAHMWRGGEVRDELLKRRHVGRDAFQDEIDLARQHPAFPHQGFGSDELLEGAQIRIRLAREVDRSEYRHVEAEPAGIEQAAIALDIPLLLQRTDPPQARRWRNTDPFRQFNIGDSAVGLDLAENLEVDFVQMLRHVRPGP